MSHHLAQVNIARTRAPLDSPVMADFVNALDRINVLAETSPGFVWRLQTEAGNATEVQAYDDPRIIFNLSVWDSVAALKDYVYRSMHGEFFSRRDAWFEKMGTPHLAMWWIPAGSIPGVAEAKERLQHLARHGETAQAFTFRKIHQPPA